MPFYEYECASCKHYVEVMQKISDAPLRKCPSCGKNQLKKLVSAPVFRLKGSGWYETDFKSDKENKRNLAGAEKDSSSGEAKESKTESAPAAESKSDSKPAAKESEGTKAPKPAKVSKTASAGKAAARKPAARTKAAARGGRKGR